MAVSNGTRSSTPYSPALPDPLCEEPPADQFCDVVLNGGVASGVVYPWALLELARAYRFKNIGGNSVGAMAAALAAAAEYGRCNGVENAFEVLRRLPTQLAELERTNDDDSARSRRNKKTKMLRLFQPSPPVRRLFDLFVALVREKPAPEERDIAQRKPGVITLLAMVLWMYHLWLPYSYWPDSAAGQFARLLRQAGPGRWRPCSPHSC